MSRHVWVWALVLFAASAASADGRRAQKKLAFAQEAGGKTLLQAWKRAAQQPPRLVRLADAAKCPGGKGVCVEICTDASAKCRFEARRPAALGASAKDAGYVCNAQRCVAAVVGPGGLTLLDAPRGGRFSRLVQKAGVEASGVVGVIPPFVWKWLTGSPFCCEDCWGKHRSWGLPCGADYACCAGTCGMQPGCGGGGGSGGGGGTGGGAGGTGGGGGGGETCGAAREVQGVTVTMETGQQCFFDGTVQPTMVGGKCVDVAGEGVYYGCSGEVIIEVEEPVEVETPDP